MEYQSPWFVINQTSRTDRGRGQQNIALRKDQGIWNLDQK